MRICVYRADQIPDDSLEHHGVKGMKWYQHLFGDPDTRAQYAKQKNFEQRVKGKKLYRDPDEKVEIPVGTKLYRTSVNMRDEGKNTYVTYADPDHAFYKSGGWGQILYAKEKAKGNTPENIYDQSYTTTEKLIGPSLKERRQIAIGLAKNDPSFRREMAIGWVRKKIEEDLNEDLEDHVDNTKPWKDELRRLSKKAIDQNVYPGSSKNVEDWVKDYLEEYNHHRNLIKKYAKQGSEGDSVGANLTFSSVIQYLGNNPKLMEKYTNEIRKRGYNCVVDDFGQQTGHNIREAVDPLIVFDIDKHARYEGATAIRRNSQEVTDSIRTYRKWQKQRETRYNISDNDDYKNNRTEYKFYNKLVDENKYRGPITPKSFRQPEAWDSEEIGDITNKREKIAYKIGSRIAYKVDKAESKRNRKRLEKQYAKARKASKK